MKRIGSFLAGVMCGALVFSSVTAYAAGILANPSTHRVYVDGLEAQMEAYCIDGHNYFKLRDIGKELGFNVYWDEETKTVQIESGKPYSGEPPKEAVAQPDSVDYSSAVAAPVFTEVYTRKAYNAAFETLSGVCSGDLSRTGTVHYESVEAARQLEHVLADLANGTAISIRSDGMGNYEIYAHKVDRSAAERNSEALLRQIVGLSDSEKVIRINKWLCDNIIYDPTAFARIDEIGAGGAIRGNCASFASAMNYLCARAGIVCFRAHGESHYWNAVYTDGKWSFVDVSLNDQVWDYASLLLSDEAPKQMDDPAGFRFLQELLVPGSTN